MASKMQPYEVFVESELETHTLDLQVEKVINENTNTLEGDVCHDYIDIDDQCKIDDIEMDDNKVWSNWVLNQLIDLGSENVNIESIIIESGIMNPKFNQIGSIDLQIGVQIL
jgi:hypothetical protein